MIMVTRLDDTVQLLNTDLIHSVRSTPDTVITLTDKSVVVVKESLEEITRRILEYQKLLKGTPPA